MLSFFIGVNATAIISRPFGTILRSTPLKFSYLNPEISPSKPTFSVRHQDINNRPRKMRFINNGVKKWVKVYRSGNFQFILQCSNV